MSLSPHRHCRCRKHPQCLCIRVFTYVRVVLWCESKCDRCTCACTVAVKKKAKVTHRAKLKKHSFIFVFSWEIGLKEVLKVSICTVWFQLLGEAVWAAPHLRSWPHPVQWHDPTHPNVFLCSPFTLQSARSSNLLNFTHQTSIKHPC